MTVLCTTGLAVDINMPSKSHNLIVQELAARLGLHQKEFFYATKNRRVRALCIAIWIKETNNYKNSMTLFCVIY